jgi:hypothetical protein
MFILAWMAHSAVVAFVIAVVGLRMILGVIVQARRAWSGRSLRAHGLLGGLWLGALESSPAVGVAAVMSMMDGAAGSGAGSQRVFSSSFPSSDWAQRLRSLIVLSFSQAGLSRESSRDALDVVGGETFGRWIAASQHAARAASRSSLLLTLLLFASARGLRLRAGKSACVSETLSSERPAGPTSPFVTVRRPPQASEGSQGSLFARQMRSKELAVQ